jgi:hypothetical protein
LTAKEILACQNKIWVPLWWCLPSLLGFAAFLLSFPIDRRIPFWPHLNLAEIYALWFLSIAPFATIIAVVTVVKRKRTSGATPTAKMLTWAAIAVSLILNAFVLLGMWAATY